MRENAEAVFAACDAAHGRWAKILGVRSPIHSRLRLQEFINIYNITQEFMTATEKVKCSIVVVFFFFFFLVKYILYWFCICISIDDCFANVYRLVEDWVIVFGEHCNHRPRPLLISNMNLGLVCSPVELCLSFLLVFIV